MLDVLLLCPWCKKQRRFVSYIVKSKREIQGKRTSCFYCRKSFVLLSKDGTKREDNIIRIVRLTKY